MDVPPFKDCPAVVAALADWPNPNIPGGHLGNTGDLRDAIPWDGGAAFLVRGELVVTPADLSFVSSFRVGGPEPRGLLRIGDALAVVSGDDARVEWFDLSDPRDPKRIQHLRFAGWPLWAVADGDALLLGIGFQPELRPPEIPVESVEPARARRERIVKTVAANPIVGLLPWMDMDVAGYPAAIPCTSVRAIPGVALGTAIVRLVPGQEPTGSAWLGPFVSGPQGGALVAFGADGIDGVRVDLQTNDVQRVPGIFAPGAPPVDLSGQPEVGRRIDGALWTIRGDEMLVVDGVPAVSLQRPNVEMNGSARTIDGAVIYKSIPLPMRGVWPGDDLVVFSNAGVPGPMWAVPWDSPVVRVGDAMFAATEDRVMRADRDGMKTRYR